jgi:protein-disulfide isomerase
VSAHDTATEDELSPPAEELDPDFTSASGIPVSDSTELPEDWLPGNWLPDTTTPVLVGPESRAPWEDQEEPESLADEDDEEYEPARPAPRSRKKARRREPARRSQTVSQARPTLQLSRTPARDRLRVERERETRHRRRVRAAAICVGLAVLIAAGAVTAVLRHQASVGDVIVKTGSRYAGPYAPVTVNANKSVRMAQPGVTTPVLDVYEDFQCPPCRAFEKANGGVIQQLADQGKLKVVYYPFTIFSGQPQQANSTRAWAAARCAPAQNWVSYHNALFASQPALTKVNGFPLRLLAQLGKKAGIASPAFTRCVESQKYAKQDASLSGQIMSSGPDGLPTLRLNGQLVTVDPMSSALRQQLISASS